MSANRRTNLPVVLGRLSNALAVALAHRTLQTEDVAGAGECLPTSADRGIEQKTEAPTHPRPGSALLDSDGALVCAVDRLPDPRQAADGIEVAQTGLALLLEVDFKKARRRKKAGTFGSASAHPSDGAGESALGTDQNLRRAPEARLRTLAPDGAEVYAKTLERPALAGVEDISERTRPGHLGLRFPVRAYPQLPDAVRVLLDSTRKPRNRAPARHRPSHGAVDRSATDQRLLRPRAAAVSDPRSRRHLWNRIL